MPRATPLIVREAVLGAFGRVLPLALAVIAGLASAGCCENTILSEEASPDGQLVAWVERTNCGATTPFHVAVELGRKGTGWRLGRSSVVFSVDGPASVEIA